MYRRLIYFLLAAATVSTAADASPRHRHRGGPAIIVCDDRGCSDRRPGARPQTTAFGVTDASGNDGVVGSRPSGCPRSFCGCEASRYTFGEARPELYLASNWIRKFPRTAPAPGMAAARSGHVMILMSQVSGNDWMVIESELAKTGRII